MWTFRQHLAWPGCVLTLVGLDCHCRWLRWASALLLNHHDFTKQWRSEVGVRLTTVLLKAPTSHAFREMKFILRQLYRILAALVLLGMGGLSPLLITRQPCKMAPIDFLSLYSEGPDPPGALSEIVQRPPSRALLQEPCKMAGSPLTLCYSRSLLFLPGTVPHGSKGPILKIG